MFDEITDFIRRIYGGKSQIYLHEPIFSGNEKRYLSECIDSTFVSSIGEYVNLFEKKIEDFTGAEFAVATVNGTAALHTALMLSGVKPGSEVVTQPLTFVATCNAIRYCGADPMFVDVENETLGMSPESLSSFLKNGTVMKHGQIVNRKTGRPISAVVAVHTFGHPCRIDKICEICDHYELPLIEDAAESFGSFYKNRHTGTFAKFGIFSFNGNKIITSGGGGALVTNDKESALTARHITTTAKVPHPYRYIHDVIGYNYRMPNINAALGYAQIENIDLLLTKKRELAEKYNDFFKKRNIRFIKEPEHSKSNYWLNTILLKDKKESESFLKKTNESGIMTRPAWELMYRLKMFQNSFKTQTPNSDFLSDRLINLPSGVTMQTKGKRQ